MKISSVAVLQSMIIKRLRDRSIRLTENSVAHKSKKEIAAVILLNETFGSAWFHSRLHSLEFDRAGRTEFGLQDHAKCPPVT